MWFFKKFKFNVEVVESQDNMSIINDILDDYRHINIFEKYNYDGVSDLKLGNKTRYYLTFDANTLRRMFPNFRVEFIHKTCTAIEVPNDVYNKIYNKETNRGWAFACKLAKLKLAYDNLKNKGNFDLVFDVSFNILKDMFTKDVHVTDENYNCAMELCEEMLDYISTKKELTSNDYSSRIKEELETIRRHRQNTEGEQWVI